MINIDLNLYIRNTINNKWIDLVKKDKCETCGTTENLEVHHIDRFIKLLDDTLILLNLEYKDTKEYTEKELELIRLVMQGKHLEIRSKTLCKNCHRKLHKEIGHKNIKTVKIKKAVTQTELEAKKIDNYLSNMSKYNKIEKKKLREICNIGSRTQFVRVIEELGGNKYLSKIGIKEIGYSYQKIS